MMETLGVEHCTVGEIIVVHPGKGFGEAALSDFGKAKFIPAFRDGQPVACDVRLPVFYREQGF